MSLIPNQPTILVFNICIVASLAFPLLYAICTTAITAVCFQHLILCFIRCFDGYVNCYKDCLAVINIFTTLCFIYCCILLTVKFSRKQKMSSADYSRLCHVTQYNRGKTKITLSMKKIVIKSNNYFKLSYHFLASWSQWVKDTFFRMHCILISQSKIILVGTTLYFIWITRGNQGR